MSTIRLQVLSQHEIGYISPLLQRTFLNPPPRRCTHTLKDSTPVASVFATISRIMESKTHPMSVIASRMDSAYPEEVNGPADCPHCGLHRRHIQRKTKLARFVRGLSILLLGAAMLSLFAFFVYVYIRSTGYPEQLEYLCRPGLGGSAYIAICILVGFAILAVCTCLATIPTFGYIIFPAAPAAIFWANYGIQKALCD